ncbi:TRAP-type C4-dicarboxylate transport system permease small subunit [Peteryoungia aggregata LMG 23059]|uniref:TRAP transporter small permease protein n=1 Tax=Peteryoungia aggregata LMG 23059 TaxID=1368425 RepID=A0ABU0G6A7_9HYPH|nr:TRAP transporter small permease [Peteryoungia aggregata]MDQ0420474.1 TRAP-type C4-dicarboxylate transport system permease small subunit [Peteryoungia aggregata LMG 23059]
MFDPVFRYLALAGAGSFAVAACITVADVVLRQLASGILGAVDYVQLFIMSGAFLAMPYAFRVNAHVTLDLVSALLPPLGERLLAIAALILTLVFCGLLAFYTCISTLEMLASSDISMNIGLPMWFYWSPFALGMSGSTLAIGVNIADALMQPIPGPGGVE